MKPYNGYEAKPIVKKETLPKGGYVAKIMNAKEMVYDWGRQLVIGFDILEGEYKGFFQKDFAQNPNEDKKWRGTFRLRVPNDDGSEQDNWAKNSFGHATWAIEDSNPGYHWDWNEAGLKGKIVGVLFRNKEWEFNGNTGWTTECCAFCPVDEIHSGKFKMPKDKPLKTYVQKEAAASEGFEEIQDLDDLPF